MVAAPESSWNGWPPELPLLPHGPAGPCVHADIRRGLMGPTPTEFMLQAVQTQPVGDPFVGLRAV